MSITINGATNTLTAASGLTIAGNTAVTGTLSATAQITTSSTADASTSVFAGNSASVAVAGGLAVAKAIACGSQISCANLVAANSTGGLSLTNATFGNIVSTNTLYVDTTAGNIDLRPGGVTAGTFSSTGLAVTGTLSATGVISTTSGGMLIAPAVTTANAWVSFNNAGGVNNSYIGLDASAPGLAVAYSYNVWNGSNTPMIFGVNNAEAMRLSTTALTLGSGVNLVTAANYIEGAEMTAPAAPAANGFRIFAEDNGAGKTRLMVQFATGAAQQIAIEP